MTTEQRRIIYNPQLEGEPFYWQAGPTGVLLCHGFTATTAEVRLLARYLYEHGYTIAAPLLPGHYTTPEDLNRASWQAWYAEVESAYHQLQRNCNQVIVGGESTGGILALYLASQHPEILAVLAYAPALRLALSTLDTIKLHLIAPFRTSIPKDKMDDNTPWQGYQVVPLKGALQLLALQRVVRRALPRVSQPVLVVQGRNDLTVHPSVPDEISQAIGSEQAEIHWMENSSHVVIIDKEWEHVAEISLEFIHRQIENQQNR